MVYTLRKIHASWPEVTPLNKTSFSNSDLLGASKVFLGQFLTLKDNIILHRNKFLNLKDDILLDFLDNKKDEDFTEYSRISSTLLGNPR